MRRPRTVPDYLLIAQQERAGPVHEVRDLPGHRQRHVAGLIADRGLDFAEVYARCVFPISSGAVIRFHERSTSRGRP